MHMQLDRAVSNAEKNRWIPCDRESERRVKKSSSRNRNVRFKNGRELSPGTEPKTNHACKPLDSKAPSSKGSLCAKENSESFHWSSKILPVEEIQSQNVHDFTGGPLDEWARLYQDIHSKSDGLLAEVAENTIKSLGQILHFKK